LTRLVLRFSPLVFVQGRSLYDKYRRYNPSAVVDGLLHSTLTEGIYHEKHSASFHDPIRILTVSSLIQLKGLDVLLQALRLMMAEGLHVEWWCVGQGSLRNSLEDLARTLGVHDCVRFWGHVPFGSRLLGFYRDADIFVLPSHTEGVSIALLEAMAQSLLVVATSGGGTPGVIHDRINGLLVPRARPDLLAQAIANLASDKELCIRMRQAALRSARQYDSRMLAERMMHVLEQKFGEIHKGWTTDLPTKSP